ncbi:hypothetical protein GWC95_06355 [Sediminibacterium roseum]|uniref:SusE outer membrane protein domain-containing protein n=1 Tax=Sediminibacterium roseum TaxID=1978412 RepID=A0ABW9ZWY0_9BACT|nr:SusE domain-containing protein [Sediminibacterium roseum]NCI49535.1 hypothetical protein [Sediminibacterium roseum]
MKRRFLRFDFLLIVLLASLVFVSCRKTMEISVAPKEVTGFRISESSLVLLQGNVANKAATFSWAATGPADIYTVEADVSTSYFSDPIELATTKATSVTFTVGEFNALMSKLLYAGNPGRIDFRVKVQHSGSAPVYSEPTAMDVTTFKNYVTYDGSRTFKVPGNYQGWNVATAPKLIAAKGEGEYEGYINFVNPSPQVLLVKGNVSKWDDKFTYYYIGGDMFGFGGSIMTLPSGSGVYLFRANTNTNRWSSVKITSWGIAGDALNAKSKATMSDEEGNLSWSVTTDLVPGSFRIRANNSNSISFGHKAEDEAGVPSYDGENIVIRKAGNYTIELSLGVAGNYSYSIRRNS